MAWHVRFYCDYSLLLRWGKKTLPVDFVSFSNRFFLLLLSDSVWLHGISKIGSFFCLDQCFTNGLMVTPIVLFMPKLCRHIPKRMKQFQIWRIAFSFGKRNKWTIDAVSWLSITAKNHRIGNSNYTANRNNE